MPAFRTYKNSIEAIRQSSELASFLHPDYVYYKEDWALIRDTLAGERRIKEMGKLYLRDLDSSYGTAYETYKDRASFVNMTGRTLMGLVGTVFRRPIKVDGVEKEDVANVTLDGLSLNLYAKKLSYELAGLGRIGVLVDMPENSDVPYMIEYVAENILSWHTEVINGREVLTYVLLREIVDGSLRLDKANYIAANPNAPAQVLTARYRVLLLENGVYKQRLYQPPAKEANSVNPSFFGAAYTEVTPQRNGKPFDFIPMKIMGPMSPTPEIQKSPLYDIAVLNIAHYRTSAQLEHGRFNTALPVYYVNVANTNEQGDYIIGPSVVWELPLDSKAGILEYFGAGLSSLVTGLREKEEHISELGGRIMGVNPQASSENPESYRMKQQSEISILLNVTDSLAVGLTDVLIWYLDWMRKPTKGVRVRLNQDFKTPLAARELRAVALLYQSGIIAVQDLYRILQDSGFINEETTEEEFIAQLEDLKNFPNQPDPDAMSEGYANAADRTKAEIADAQVSVQEDTLQHTKDQAAHQQEMDKKDQVNQMVVARMTAQSTPQPSDTFGSSRRTQQFQGQPQPPVKGKPVAPKAGAKPAAGKAKPKPKAKK